MIKKYFNILLFAVFLNGCISSHRGYKFEDNTVDELSMFVNKGATVYEIIDNFGSPSFVNSPINDTICYVGAIGKRVAFDKFFRPKYHILCVVLENTTAKKMVHELVVLDKQPDFIKYKLSLYKKPL